MFVNILMFENCVISLKVREIVLFFLLFLLSNTLEIT
uniref:Uncharacterized protein n=1 Tax=Manihot esculenta TaxID=3983 RepID=A0A2C9W350_MANES